MQCLEYVLSVAVRGPKSGSKELKFDLNLQSISDSLPANPSRVSLLSESGTSSAKEDFKNRVIFNVYAFESLPHFFYVIGLRIYFRSVQKNVRQCQKNREVTYNNNTTDPKQENITKYPHHIFYFTTFNRNWHSNKIN